MGLAAYYRLIRLYVMQRLKSHLQAPKSQAERNSPKEAHGNETYETIVAQAILSHSGRLPDVPVVESVGVVVNLEG
jgi:hypothetical protein